MRTQFSNIIDLANEYISQTANTWLNQSVTVGSSEMIFDVYCVVPNTQLTSSVLTGCAVNDANSQLIVGYNLSIAEGVTLTPPYRCKGLFIVSGAQFINNGVISMTARGASAAGVNIPLISDKFVSAVGGSGGARTTGTSSSYGRPGNSGLSPASGVISCGGGGSGGAGTNTSKQGAGAGGAGTSFSGGAGGGGTPPTYSGGDGSSTGGSGGTAGGVRYGSDGRGGAGNPVGASSPKSARSVYDSNGEGTGGLLVIASPTITSQGTIISSGSQGPGITGSISYNGAGAGGGASGGGCVCLIADTFNITGSVSAPGGAISNYPYAPSSTTPTGGAGGAGSAVQVSLEHTPIGDITTRVYYTSTQSVYSQSVPIRNGQLLFETDKSGLYYDWAFSRRGAGDSWEGYTG